MKVIIGQFYDDSDLEVVNNKETYDTKWYVSNGTKYSQDIKVNTEAVGSLTNSFKAVDKRTAEKLGLTVSEFNNEYELKKKHIHYRNLLVILISIIMLLKI